MEALKTFLSIYVEKNVNFSVISYIGMACILVAYTTKASTVQPKSGSKLPAGRPFTRKFPSRSSVNGCSSRYLRATVKWGLYVRVSAVNPNGSVAETTFFCSSLSGSSSPETPSRALLASPGGRMCPILRASAESLCLTRKLSGAPRTGPGYPPSECRQEIAA